jgi:YVTN family beta-propeller protein
VAEELLSGTVTFVFTDIEGSTRLLSQLRDRYGDVLADHERILRKAFAGHGGRVVDTQGDSFFAVFPRARDAVAAAVAAQRAVAEHEWPDGADVRVRMGLHTGEPVVGGERYVGLGVHRAARIGGAAHGGQILLSNTTRELVEDELPADIGIRDLGEHELKDLPRRERLFQLVPEGLPAAFPPPRSAVAEAFAGREGELAEAARETVATRRGPRRAILLGALAGVVAAAVAVPVFALGGGSGGDVGDLVGDSVVRIDDGGGIAGEATLGTAPTAVTYGGGALWATNGNAGTVSRIDPQTNDVDRPIRVGGGPAGIAYAERAVWVANSLSGTVSRISTETSEVAGEPIPTGNRPVGVAAGAGGVWVTNADDGTVVRIDPSSGEVTKRFQLSGADRGIAVHEGAVWVTDEAGGHVTRLDPTNGLTETRNVGEGPSGIAIAGGSVWVANSLDGTVTQIDEETLTVKDTIPVGDGTGAVVAADGDVWASSEFTGQVTRIDASTGEVEEITDLGHRPRGLVGTPAGVWIAVPSGGEAHRGGTLRVAVRPSEIDPAVAYDPEAWALLSTTNNGLLAFRRTGGSEGRQVVPDLAASVPEATDAGKTYTFRLRRGVKYSTGQPVRARDFRYALERVLRLAPEGDTFYGGIVGAAACSKRACDLSRGIVTNDSAGTVTFRLTGPDPDFLYKLTVPFAYPVPRSVPARVMKTPVPATGPYRLVTYEPGRLARAVRNPRFRRWSGAAQPGGYPDVIEWRATRDAIRAVERGEVDLASIQGDPGSGELRTNYPAQVHVNPGKSTYFFFLNTRLRPFSSAAARRAVNYAVDRDRVIEIAGGEDFGTATCQVLPPNFPGYRPYCPYRHDLDIARRLVASSGTRGAHVTVWTSPGVPAGPEQARYFTRVLRTLGYRPTLRVREAGEYFGSIYDGRPGEHTGPLIWFADFPSSAYYIQPNFSCGVPQPSFFCDRRIERAIARAVRAQIADPPAAQELWAGIDRRLVDLAPWVPLYTFNSADFVSRRVGNYQYNPQWGVLVEQLWVK